MTRYFFGVAVASAMLPALLAASSDRARADDTHTQIIPNFASPNYGWLTVDDELKPMTTGPRPVRNDANYPYYGNQSGTQPTYRISNSNNPVLTEWSKEILKKSNEGAIAGKFPYTFQSRCMPGGVPGQLAGVFEPVYFAQSEKEVLMMWQRDHVVRHIYMNVPVPKSETFLVWRIGRSLREWRHAGHRHDCHHAEGAHRQLAHTAFGEATCRGAVPARQ